MPDAPKVGQIVEHYFLWPREHHSGESEGRKPRPCLIIAVEERPGAAPRVTVLPITSQPPGNGSNILAIPRKLNVRLGLDASRDAWIVVDTANVFAWPGFDLVPQAGGGFVRGQITAGLFERVRQAVLAAHSRAQLRPVDRDKE
jgi:mRNA-degrading endonuclease toxin of MazEF toxin-antitoxin module